MVLQVQMLLEITPAAAESDEQLLQGALADAAFREALQDEITACVDRALREYLPEGSFTVRRLPVGGRLA